jgi:hypothetical protein
MNRFNKFQKLAPNPSCVAGGNNEKATNLGAILFAALLIACSVTVGCSSEKPKPSTAHNQIPVPQNPAPSMASNTPASLAEPAQATPKKVVRKRPATVTYSDQTYGVSFDYPRKYAIETGDAANEFVSSAPLPLNFVQPGGVALAAVELPETGFANTDFSSAFFNVSVHKDLTAEQCGEFSVPQPLPAKANDETSETSSTSSNLTSPSAAGRASTSSPPKLMLGDLELQGTEAVSGEGTRQSDAKYFHAFQNRACYEFALNVTTMARNLGAGMKHVDRDKVFARLEQILSTVKINPVAALATEQTAPVEAAPATASEPTPSTTTPAASTSTPAAASDVTASTPAPSAQDAPVAPQVQQNSPQ